MYENVLKMSYPKEENDRVWKTITKHILGTYGRYPFVPHWACSTCLTGKEKGTEELNNKYKNLTLEIGSNFHEKFLNNVKDALLHCEETNNHSID